MTAARDTVSVGELGPISLPVTAGGAVPDLSLVTAVALTARRESSPTREAWTVAIADGSQSSGALTAVHELAAVDTAKATRIHLQLYLTVTGRAAPVACAPVVLTVAQI